MSDDSTMMAAVFQGALEEFGDTSGKRIVDVGCGAGRLVEALMKRGLDAYGCDVASYLAEDLEVPADRFATLTFDPYVLPYEDNSVDAVVSTSVLEHVQNPEELMREIKRVLKPGGLSMHAMPAKWYLPSEPHIFVPLVSWLWPHVPGWWLALWAKLGIRNEFQKGLSAAEVAELNRKFVKTGISYLSTSTWSRISMDVFGNVRWPMRFYLSRAHGGVAKVWRLSPAKGLVELLSRELRMAFMVQKKV